MTRKKRYHRLTGEKFIDLLFNEAGRLHGLGRRWYENGQLMEEATYANGLVVGRYRLWDDKGELVKDEMR
jgi:antitoxin component YwqK of YwqJK toxin-antitoxin module